MTKTLIIAEAGVNHNGDINIAKKLIEKAADAGADFIKFQTFITENVVTKNAKRAEYQNTNTGNNDSQYEMIKRLELSHEMHNQILLFCKEKRINFLSTGFDLESLDYLHNLKIPIFKIPSGEITNLPYLKKVASFKKPVIMSTGMANFQEVKNALDILQCEGICKKDITILHCNTEYPTPMQDVNLKAMNTMGKAFGVRIGYSDHTLGIEVPIAAVALGAEIIEKHFTLDRKLPGPDHKASLEPNELKNMILAIRNIEKAISGTGIKEPSASEKKNIAIARKSIVAGKKISQGEILSEENLSIKRPGTGISPMKWEQLIGQVAKKDFQEDDLIEI